MVQLYKVDSPINREQRNNLNATFTDILNRFSNLRYQISILSGGEDLEEILQHIEDAITNANNTTADTQQVLNDISDALNQLSTALQNSDNAADNANDAATNAQNEISNMQNYVNQLGNAETYDNSKTYSKNNIAEYNGSSFIALQQTTGNAPPTLPTKRNDFWQLLAQRGVDGTGSVASVNNQSPDVNGNVQLTPGNIGAASDENLTTLQQQLTTHLGDYNEFKSGLSLLTEVHMSQSQTFSPNQIQEVQFDTITALNGTESLFERQDGIIDLRVTQGGVYLLSVDIISDGTEGFLYLDLIVNAEERERLYYNKLENSEFATGSLSSILKLNAGDLVRVRFEQRTGSALNIISDARFTKITAIRLGDIQ